MEHEDENLQGLRILIIEDEPTLAFVFKLFLEEAGGQVVGPANSVNAALRILETEKFDCAIMDVRLANETVFPVARKINENGIPFAFVTGNSRKTLPPEFHDKKILLKPVDFSQVISLIKDLTKQAGTA